MSTWSHRIGVTSLLLLFAVGLLPMPALSQQQQSGGEIFEIVVTSPRVQVQETHNRMGRGARVSMSYTVGFADLDLSTQSGRVELEGRVREAATEMCLLLAERYAADRTDATRCTRQAVDDAMPQVQAAIAAAQEQ